MLSGTYVAARRRDAFMMLIDEEGQSTAKNERHEVEQDLHGARFCRMSRLSTRLIAASWSEYHAWLAAQGAFKRSRRNADEIEGARSLALPPTRRPP